MGCSFCQGFYLTERAPAPEIPEFQDFSAEYADSTLARRVANHQRPQSPQATSVVSECTRGDLGPATAVASVEQLRSIIGLPATACACE